MTNETIKLPEPFGYVGPSMLRRAPRGASPTFQGTYERVAAVDFKQTALFTADQVRAAVLEATLAERERCAQVAERDDFYGSALQHDIAAAIRRGT